MQQQQQQEAMSSAEAAAASPVLLLDHVNLNAPDWTAELEQFWFSALGCVSDPRGVQIGERIHESGGSMRALRWLNVGFQQLHVPIGEAQDSSQAMSNGIVGLAFEDLSDLRQRLREHGVGFEEESGDGAEFVGTGIQYCGGALVLRSPTGINLRLHSANSWFAPKGAAEAGVAQPGGKSLGLGMPYVEYLCKPGTSAGIGRFYSHCLGASVEDLNGVCRVLMQTGQFLLFREVETEIPTYDNHHVAIYLARIETGDLTDSFAAAYKRCKKAGLVWNNPRFANMTYDTLEDAQRHGEFRVLDLADPTTGEVVFRLEHEIRSLLHPTCPCKQMLRDAPSANL